MLLTEFDIVYVTQKAIKGQAIADQLAKSLADNYEPMRLSYLLRAKMRAKASKDGGCTSMGHPIAKELG